MLVSEAVNTKTVVLKIGDSFLRATEMMAELQVRTLPVMNVSTNEIIGRISRDRVQAGNAGQLISREDLDEPIVIFNNQHLFEAIKMMLEYEIDLLPVV